MLRRFFCLGPNVSDAEGDWVVARTQYMQTQKYYSAAKILEIVEDDVEDRYRSIENNKKTVLEAGSMRRLHRANLAIEDSQRATEVLVKVTMIDRARHRAEKERKAMTAELDAVKERKRAMEFEAASWQQMAEARADALYRCQEKLKEAEEQQVQLADMLKLTLDKLGMALTPSPGMDSRPTSAGDHRSPLQLPDRPTGPLFSPAAELDSLSSPAGSPTEVDTPNSGFTVYSNDLVCDKEEPRSTAVATGAPMDANAGSDSATKWRDISEVALRASAPLQQRHQNHQALDAASTPLPASLLQEKEQADRLARCILPHLEPAQRESLVRVSASMGSPLMASPAMQHHLRQALAKNPAIAGKPAMGPLQATRFAAEAQADENYHITTVFGLKNGYGPLSAGAAATGAAPAAAPAAMPPLPPSHREAAAVPAPARRKSTFRVHQSDDVNASNCSARIKAVMPQDTPRQGPAGEEGIERWARQQRAAERLAKKVNSKLPLESRRADPLNLGVAIASGDPRLGSAGKLGPRGSLRRQAAELQARAAVENGMA